MPAYIIVATDDEAISEFVEDTLRRAGHEVASTHSGCDLVRICQSIKFDLIIADIRLADTNIFDALGAAPPVDTPIIIISGYDNPDWREHAGELSIMAYLKKPLKPDDVVHAVELGLARFEELRAARKAARDAQRQARLPRSGQE
jgi:AmiR/NasT family two-component response regulator